MKMFTTVIWIVIEAIKFMGVAYTINFVTLWKTMGRRTLQVLFPFFNKTENANNAALFMEKTIFLRNKGIDFSEDIN